MWLKVLKYEALIIILAGVVVMRIPTLFEPYWYGDEGIYLTIGQSLNKGETLYKDIHDNKPPLLYVMAAIADGNEFWFKSLGGLFNLGAIVAFWWLASEIWKGQKKIITLSTGLFAVLTTIPLFEGNIANAELFFLLPTILAMGILWRAKRPEQALLGGLLFGLAGLFKIPALLEAGVWPVVWMLRQEKRWFVNSIVLCAGVALPLVASAIYFSGVGAGKEYWIAAWTQNLPYLSSWKPATETGIFALKGRAEVVILVLVILWLGRKKWERKELVVVMWSTLGLFAALLSGRPYPHYLLQIMGIGVIVITMLVVGKMKEKAVMAGIMLMIAGAMVAFRFWSYPVAGYYINFGSWMTGQKSTSQYFGWFNQQTNRDYEIAALIKAGSKSEDVVFVWGDDAQIYALSRRSPATKYIVKYHIKDYDGEAATMTTLRRHVPKYIVVMDDPNGLQGLTNLLKERYILQKSVGGVLVYRIIDGWTSY